MNTKDINNLVVQAQAGDKTALEKLYNHFFDQIYYYTYSRVNNIHNTQEIVSEVFLSLVEGIKKFKGQSSFKNYIFGITKNKILDYIKYKYKYGEHISQSSFDEDVYNNLPDERSFYDEDTSKKYRVKIRKVFTKILESMRPRYANVLDLRFNQMNTIEQTAEILGISPNNVKVIQHRAIKQAKSIWDKMSETEAE
jgi:RNA polymerase sigma-70 factor (ECF subfamily)